MDSSTLIGVVVAGIGVGFSAMGLAVRGMAKYLTSIWSERIAKLEEVCAAVDKRNDDLNTYIRHELAALTAEAHMRERDLFRVMRKCPEADRASESDTDRTPTVKPRAPIPR